MLIVPPGKSLFHIKMFDDPIPHSGTHGLVHYVVEYDHPASILHQGYERRGVRPEYLLLTIEKSEAK